MSVDVTPSDADALPAEVAAVTDRATFRLGTGVYLLKSPLRLPAWPARVVIEGDGTLVSMFDQFRTGVVMGPLDGCATGCVVRGLAIQRPPVGTAIMAAFWMNRMRACRFDDITIVSGTGGAGVFPIGFAMSAVPDANGPGACHANSIRGLILQSQVGPRYVVWSDGINDPAEFANGNTIRDAWVYANSGVLVVYCLNRTTATRVEGGLVEGNPGALVLVPGQLTTFRGVWVEQNGTAVQVSPMASMMPNGGSVERCYFSDKDALPPNLPAGVDKASWSFLGNAGPGGGKS